MQLEKVVNHIVNWLKDYANKSGVNGFVIGVSGGIDSAVTSTLCAQTDLPVLCLEMPIHQATSHVSRCQEHLLFLKHKYTNISDCKINLTPVFEAFKSEVSTNSDAVKVDMTLANTRARMRMLTLYYHAGIHNCLVAGTGNKVEDFGVGFYTKYGDGGVDLSPIADLLKSEVYDIGSYLGVPDSIMKAPPSDGLFGDTRSDEDQIGANYDELEWAMKMDDLHKKITDFSGREREVFQIFKNYNSKNQHKMMPIPVCKIPNDLK